MPENDPSEITSRKALGGRNAVVTGSSSGIGRSLALALAAAGANVIVHARSSTNAAEKTAERCRAHGVESEVLLADLINATERRTLIDAAWALRGDIDIWVNNAGADVLTTQARHATYEEKLDLLWKVDVLGSIDLARQAGERMRARGSGVILNMGWDQAATGMEGESGEIFATVKGAVMAFSRSLARSLAPSVRVNCLAPGWIRTTWGETASKEWQERVLAETPLKRWGTPEDVAQTALFLVSPSASFITGQIIPINGGAVR